VSANQVWDEYYKKLRTVLEIPEEEEDKLTDEFLSFIRSHQDEFIHRLRDIPGTDDYLIYGILMTLTKDPNPWKNQLVSLLSRLFDEAKRAADYKQILKAIDGFAVLPSHKFDRDLSGELLDIVYKEFDSKDQEIRRVAVDLTACFMEPGDARSMERLSKMRSDSYWKARVLAVWAINESKNLPLNSGLSLFDRLRLIFGGRP
jgi:hypothetical protein